MLYGTGLSSDITTCITEAENCMSLLLSDDVFNLAADKAQHNDDFDDTASRGFESHNCKESAETEDMNEQLDIVESCNSQLQSEHRDDDLEISADNVSDGIIKDVVRSGDESMATSADTDTEGQHDTNIHRQHGVHSFRYAIHIDVANHIRVEQTQDNADVVRTLQELSTLLVNRYVPTVKRWLEVGIHNRRLSVYSVCIFLTLNHFRTITE